MAYKSKSGKKKHPIIVAMFGREQCMASVFRFLDEADEEPLFKQPLS